MYRLITPVIDYANNVLQNTVYFEFNQTSDHGTHQSVDIALVDDHNHPTVLIEAKRIDRVLNADQIHKYMDHDTRGIVTNGLTWILCFQDKHKVCRLYDNNTINTAALDEITKFIRDSRIDNSCWDTKPNDYHSSERPNSINKEVKAVRKTHPKTVIKSPSDFAAFIRTIDDSPPNEAALLTGIHRVIEESIPSYIQIETRDTRISFFDNRITDKSKRVARIELVKVQPDIIVLTRICDEHQELASISTPTIHDKGAHMRRFRLQDQEQAKQFGQALISALIE